MTTREKFEKMLTDRGMWPKEATAVMDLAIIEIDGDECGIKWGAPAGDYPNTIYAVLYLTIRPIALKYIDDTIPKAFYRSMFTEED